MRYKKLCMVIALASIAGLAAAGPQFDVLDLTAPAEPVSVPSVTNDLPRPDDYLVPRMAPGDAPADPNGMGPGGVFAQVDTQGTVDPATPGVYSSPGQNNGLRYSPVSYGGGGGVSPSGGGYPIYPGGGGGTTIITNGGGDDGGNEVPEPATLALLGSGMVAMSMRRKRHKQ